MVGTQYQAEVPSSLSHYKDGEKGNCCFICFHHVPEVFLNVIAYNVFLCIIKAILYVLFYAAYEDEDELLWSPGTLPESKVRSFLSEVLSRTTDEKTGCDKPGIHVRDNEQVSHVFYLSILSCCNHIGNQL